MKRMEQLDEINSLLFRFSKLGINKSLLGATLIGKAPHIAPEAWLNCIYPVISSNEIEALEQEIGIKMPSSYVMFLNTFSNGLTVLTDTLCLFGKRAFFNRSNTEYVRQPYDIVNINKYERPKNASDEMLFIGSYDWDGSYLYMMPDQTVHFCHRKDATSLYSWESLYTMLIDEIKRLYGLFDSNGVQIDETVPTVPSL